MKMALREKSALHAQVASLQKTNFDFARSKNILQAKVIKYAATVECTNEIELPYVEHMIVVLIALTLTCKRMGLGIVLECSKNKDSVTESRHLAL